MGTCDAKAPGYFALERWMLGWLDENQIYCHDSGEIIVDLKAMEKNGGIKAIITPLDTTRALLVESRKKIEFVQNMEKGGALVYRINTQLETGNGPLQVKSGVDNGNKLFEDAPMKGGDTYTFQNVRVEVLESKKDGDKVKVMVNKKE